MIPKLAAVVLLATLTLIPVSGAVAPIQPLKQTDTGRIYCTAFSINQEKSYWMTAMHCVQDGEKVYLPYLGESGEPTKLVAGFPDVDIAILSANTSAVALPLAPSAPLRGSAVSVTGFGWGFDPPTTFWGRVSNVVTVETRKYLIFDMNVWPGHSGSPVQNAAGQVVSVTQISAGGIAGGSTWEDLERRTAKYWGD